MIKLKLNDFNQTFFYDENACLEWLKATLYPHGIECHVCKKVTKHHKVSKRHCYVCDSCGNHLYPTSGTIFHKSNTPLSIWFKVIHQMQTTNRVISAKEIQREYGLSYKRAFHIVKKSREFLDENYHNLANGIETDNTKTNALKNDIGDPRVKQMRYFSDSNNSSNATNIQNFRNINKKTYERSDRIARTLKLQMLLWQNPQGLKIEEIAQKCAVSKKTVYRDLKTLEFKLKIPLWEERSRRGIVEGYFLPAINFTVSEAKNIFLAVRMMNQLTPQYNPSIISTCIKLSKIVPDSLRKHIQYIIEYLEKQPKDKRAESNFDKLTQAWLLQHKVKIYYQENFKNEPVEYIIEPYFIEPVPFIHSCYVIAYCQLQKFITAFNVDYIRGDVIIEPDTFKIPSDFNPMEYLSSAWGIRADNGIKTVKLHLKSGINKFLIENINTLQNYIETQKDGSMVATFKVRDIKLFCQWVIKYYDNLEVLEPEALRDQILETATTLLNTYSKAKRVDLSDVVSCDLPPIVISLVK